ncbi:MAG: YceI family protein [Thermoanaerobaculia bacterium]|nr:YceI family protein [Thermoanaerobaculia bacterium]
MKQARIFRTIAGAALPALALVLASACSDPAADKPDAVVQEAKPASETSAPAGADVKTFEISPESKIGFIGSKVTGSHHGGFNKFHGQITLVDGNPVGSKVEVTIDTPSLWADNEKLAGHLKSADFFDVGGHPTAIFTSTEIVPDPEGGFQITGNLSLHGIVKQISFPALIDVVEGGVRAKSEFSINRFDFNIVYPGKPDDLIREEVVIQLDLKTVGLEEPAAEEDSDPGEGDEEAPQEETQ